MVANGRNDMQTRYWRFATPEIERDVCMARWGWYGKPVIWFPTGGGDYLDAERFWIVKCVEPLVRAGRIKLYSVDSVSWAWTNPEVSPQTKTTFQARYDRILTEMILPSIREDCEGSDQKMAVCGASVGGYDALNAATKHPDQIDLMIGMSGTYVLDRRLKGYWDENYYFNMPVQFLPGLNEAALENLRQSLFVLALGSGPAESPDYTLRVASVLRSRQIPHRVEIWGPGSDHDWPTWRTMLPLFLDRLV